MLHLIPRTTDNAIEAGGNVPAGNAHPLLNADAQHPTLPPFIEHAVNAEVNALAKEDIIVGDYHIHGVADIIGVESQRHVIAFYEATIPLLEKAPQSIRLMTKSKFEVIKEALLHNREGDESIAELWSEYPKWNKAFAVVVNGDSTVVVARPPDIIGQEAIDINFVKRITYLTGKGNNVELNGLTDEWVEVNEDHLGKGGSKERIYCGWSRQG